jgi:hypothetical protein
MRMQRMNKRNCKSKKRESRRRITKKNKKMSLKLMFPRNRWKRENSISSKKTMILNK